MTRAKNLLGVAFTLLVYHALYSRIFPCHVESDEVSTAPLKMFKDSMKVAINQFGGTRFNEEARPIGAALPLEAASHSNNHDGQGSLVEPPNDTLASGSIGGVDDSLPTHHWQSEESMSTNEVMFVLADLYKDGSIKPQKRKYPVDLCEESWLLGGRFKYYAHNTCPGKPKANWTVERFAQTVTTWEKDIGPDLAFFNMQTKKFEKLTPWAGQSIAFVGGWPFVNFRKPILVNFRKRNDHSIQKPLNDKCIIYSFGIGGDFFFEAFMANWVRCHVFAYDPTEDLKVKHKTETPTYVKFFYKGLRGAIDNSTQSQQSEFFLSDEGRNAYGHINLDKLRNLEEVVGDRYLEVLKIDCEGCEWDVFASLDPQWLGNHVQKLMIEVHFKKGQPTLKQYSNFWDLVLRSHRLYYRHLTLRDAAVGEIERLEGLGVTELRAGAIPSNLSISIQYAFENINSYASAHSVKKPSGADDLPVDDLPVSFAPASGLKLGSVATLLFAVLLEIACSIETS